MNPYWVLIRPQNAIMAAIGTYLGFALAMGAFVVSTDILLLMLSVLFISGAGQTLNDFFDVEIDKKIHPHRPIPAKHISTRGAFAYAMVLMALGNILALWVGMIPFLMAFFFTALLTFYAGWSKSHKWLGNWMVALSSASVFIFGATIVGRFELPLLVAIPSLFASVAREITKDLEDEQKGEKEKTILSHLVGKKNAIVIAVGCVVVAIFSALVPLFKGLLSQWYLIGVGFGIVLFVVAVSQLRKEQFAKSQRTFKHAMLLCMIGFAMGLL